MEHRKFVFVLLILLIAFLFVPTLFIAQNNLSRIEEVKNGKRIECNADWWGYDENDATIVLQNSISSGAKRIIVKNMGKPWIVSKTINLQSNQEIILEKGVVILAKEGSFLGKAEALFIAKNKTKIIISGNGSELAMRKDDYTKPPYEKAEWRHLVVLESCDSVIIEDLKLSNSGGDGIYIGRTHTKDGLSYCKDVYIRNVISTGNLRQGMSVISVKNLSVENSEFSNTSGSNPQSGIDFEPNYPDELLENCSIVNCKLQNNKSCGLIVAIKKLNENSKPISLIVKNCSIVGNSLIAVLLQGGKHGDKLKGTITFSDNIIVGRQTQKDFNDIKVEIDGKTWK